MEYDVIIIGGGPAGIFASYELSEKAPDMKILLIDKGNDIYSRKCPILSGKIKQCPERADHEIGCLPACSITAGFGGAGAFSDGKFNITTEFGGWLNEYMPPSKLLELIKYVDDINLIHGATKDITDPTTEEVMLIEQKAWGAGLKLLRAYVRHLGTEANLQILKNIYEFLKNKLHFIFKEEVEEITTVIKDGKPKVTGVVLKNGSEYRARYVVAAPGRDGSAWLTKELKDKGLEMINNRVDVGVRAETSDVIMRDINKHLYEGKFIYNTKFGTQVRTFCSNPSGHVVIENHSGIMAANGHSYKDPKLGSSNTNFALLVSHKFTEPFNKPNEYAREICKRANELSNGSVIIQKFGDIIRGRRSTVGRIEEGFIEPTLKEAVPGDLGLVLPYVTMQSIIEMVYALDKVTPGMASEHTLFYGVEAKFYSARPHLTNNLATEIEGLYCGGDGAGLTRGLAQAGASGILIARDIVRRIYG